MLQLPDTRRPMMAISAQLMGQWLQRKQLPLSLVAQLSALGAHVPSNLVDIDIEQDVPKLALKQLESKRFIRAIERLRAGEHDMGEGWTADREKAAVAEYLLILCEMYKLTFLRVSYQRRRSRMDILNLLLSTVATVFGAGIVIASGNNKASPPNNATVAQRRLAGNLNEQEWVRWLVLAISIVLTLILGYKKLANWDQKIDKLREVTELFNEQLDFMHKQLQLPGHMRMRFRTYANALIDLKNKQDPLVNEADISPGKQTAALRAVRAEQGTPWQEIQSIWQESEWDGG
jgi:hypothetical protein